MPSFFYTCQNILAQQNKMTLNTAEFILKDLATFMSLSCRCTNIYNPKGMKHFVSELILMNNYFNYVINYLAIVQLN